LTIKYKKIIYKDGYFYEETKKYGDKILKFDKKGNQVE